LGFGDYLVLSLEFWKSAAFKEAAAQSAGINKNMANESGTENDKQKQGSPPKAPAATSTRSFWGRPVVILLGSALLAFLFFLGLEYLLRSFTHESTDDAFLDGEIISVAPKIAGQVQKVLVHNNQPVKAGDPLIEIDPRDFQVAFEQKKAAVESARANVELLRASLDLLSAQVQSAEATARESASQTAASRATADKAQADLKRAQELFAQKTISPQEFDAAKAAADSAAAGLQAAGERAAGGLAKVQEMRAQLQAGKKAYERGEAQTRQAEWDTKSAQLNLSYATVAAPEDGFVTRKAVEAGDFVQIGQRIMALVTARLWVTANFKETQLELLRTNQPAIITLDSLGGREFKAHVESIQAGSGARFSMLPPENAVGNYVKVVQRVPVRLFFDEPVSAEHVLGPGMSVTPSVRVRSFEVSEAVLIVIAIVLGALVAMLWFWGARRGGNSKDE
jgi:membrane fusion protein, multidrug efflux system